ncbi:MULTISPECIES: beta-ketoacyl-ACP synthase [Aphanizomenon]|uniref:Beta-ketoacyl-ACP synthase n=1 Tax=Aphanizomenon flos-aquae FACHB-1249 TaxID=2692889 RepID=A0ABR8ISQ3_APHFL|nr:MULTISPECIES: beta-ketoacyl-ACP synthase [Aphanizomenon]MBD2390522.1 beta-ketoacyl-ACP synthase [Aphanizomenon flos-aquae FACHB-1171]MBD2556027.1 beta-ketoacyl-ACP synthase [Aphanizomenon flos-aquae FACHB-1290]MBD2631441.1 beta-ketoacyl-ACP synthase [Aphanizomenon sp. FACHB-1399]MBD2642168.1 beta-ketoacyl-ACP synthase [Aphanizomenon sp. FACHB-1401]MBD2657391.1 beta-ketoacyl-ACP synthase [Aphanizomenon flos-aquae FACHB-1265]
MVRVVVTGIALVSSLGKNLETCWRNLLLGKTGIKLHQPFPELGIIPLGLIAEKPFSLNTLTEILVTSALQDAQLVAPLPDCGVVIGSSRSYQASWELMAQQVYQQEAGLNLDDWLNTLPQMNAIAVARQIGSTGAVLAPMAACATGISAIAQATMLIKTGQYQQVITGAIETPITPLTIAGFRQMGALAKTGAYPFDLQREGLVLGEGGAVFILESAELATQRQARIYGEILGFGLTADAYHGTSPQPEGKSAIMAIKQCLERSHILPTDIDYIHTHGTATQLNDRMESKIIQSLFPAKLAISSTKGSTGHTLGASGALGVAFSLMALQEQILPPCVGLQQPEYNLNFIISAQESKIQQVLCLSFGFGGQNAVIALGNLKNS